MATNIRLVVRFMLKLMHAFFLFSRRLALKESCGEARQYYMHGPWWALSYRGYAQGVASRDDLIFSVIYRISSWNEWLRAGALYGNLTRDAVLAFLGQICALAQQTDYKVSIILLRYIYRRLFSETGLAHF